MPRDERPKLTDAELDERIAGSIARILATVDRNRTRRERYRQQADPTITTDRTDAITNDREGIEP